MHVDLDLVLNLKLGVSFRCDVDLDLVLNLKLGVSFRSSCPSRSRSRSKTKFSLIDFNQLYEPFYLSVKSSPNLVIS